MKISSVRRVVQIIFLFILFPLLLPLFYCPAPIPWVACDSCPVGWCPSKYMRRYVIYLLLLTGIIFGRAFCGWLCPLGTLQDCINFASKKVSEKDVEVKGRPKVKFFFLALSLFFGLHALGFGVIALPPAWFYMPALFFLILFFSALVPRMWCRFACPAGALVSLFNKISIIKFRREGCKNCNACGEVCEMKTGEVVDLKSTDCIRCMKCLEACKENAIKVKIK